MYSMLLDWTQLPHDLLLFLTSFSLRSEQHVQLFTPFKKVSSRCRTSTKLSHQRQRLSCYWQNQPQGVNKHLSKIALCTVLTLWMRPFALLFVFLWVTKYNSSCGCEKIWASDEGITASVYTDLKHMSAWHLLLISQESIIRATHSSKNSFHLAYIYIHLHLNLG